MKQGVFHPEFITHSLSFGLYKEAVEKRNWNKMAELILQSIEKLEIAGADFIIIPSNTPHYAIEVINLKSKLPVINLIEIVAKKCSDLKLKNVAVLGTNATMQDGLYDSYLKKYGIQPIIPDEETRDRINDLIFNEIIPSTIKKSSVDDVLQRIKAIPCDGVILGCTELPEVYSFEDIQKPTIDTTRYLAEVALNEALALS